MLRIRVFLLLFCNSVFSLEALEISFTSEVSHGNSGSFVSMDCDVTNMPATASIQFSKITPGGTIIIDATYDPRKYLVMNNFLMIVKFERSDAGNYRCSVLDNNNQIAYKELTLNFEAPASIVRFDKYSYDFNKGDEFKVYCNATGAPSPKVWWEKRDDNKFKIEGPLLHIPHVTADDIGTYFCYAENEHNKRPDRDEVRIRRVHYAPEMTCNDTTMESGMGWNKYVLLKCEVRSFPVASMEYYKKTETGRQRILEQDPKYVIMHAVKYDDSPQGWYYLNGLHIMVTKTSDAGKYIIVASNEFGSQEEEFTLKVV